MLSQGLTGRTPQHFGQKINNDATTLSGLQNVAIRHLDEELSQNEMTNRTQNVGFGAGASSSQANKDSNSKATYTIVPIEFETVGRLKMFLESLFQLKPNLLTSYSLDKFRIVVEIS
mmetsp:Transcript_47936/g.63448  ORF Transcript_47936/g.63448 Transcript_47936/m.63448 type:complete len:117 (+) Transcript_47936:2320-2670(+)